MSKTIREIRRSLGYTMEDVTILGGPKFSAYAKIDAGTAKPENITVESFVKICKVFEMEPTELLTTLGLWQKSE